MKYLNYYRVYNNHIFYNDLIIQYSAYKKIKFL